MFDDASRTRRTDEPSRPGLADYVIVTALLVVTAIATYGLFDGAGGDRMADAVSVETVPAASVVR